MMIKIKLNNKGNQHEILKTSEGGCIGPAGSNHLSDVQLDTLRKIS